jgi:hypothetical protein
LLPQALPHRVERHLRDLRTRRTIEDDEPAGGYYRGK